MTQLKPFLDDLLRELHDEGELRVWSVIITIFGDVVVPRGRVIALSSLLAITRQLQIEDNAVRTALSRLAQDGWVQRQKSGRQSFYSLTPDRRVIFESAESRIYAASSTAWSGTFEVCLVQNQNHKSRPSTRREMLDLGFGSPMPDMFIRPKRDGLEPVPKTFEMISLDAIQAGPDERRKLVRLAWPIDQLVEEYEVLERRFAALEKLVADNDANDVLTCLALRVLLIHEWRKLVLRDVDLPIECKTDSDAESNARGLVSRLYGLLLAPSECWLDANAETIGGPMTSAEPVFFKRFKG